MSGENRQLMLDEFFYRYRPHHIASSKGTYQFSVREKDLKLVFDMPDSNRNWKIRYFFVEGTDWVCREEEWAQCLVATLTTHGLLSKSQVEPVSRSFAYFILTLLISSTFSCL